jgi:hypothetical protein
VDDEDRDTTADVTKQTAIKFKLVSELVDVLEQYGAVPDTWNKNSNIIINLILEKYCKFKCVDIMKCLNAGTVPKRGNPNEKEKEDDVADELNAMIQENESNSKSEL